MISARKSTATEPANECANRHQRSAVGGTPRQAARASCAVRRPRDDFRWLVSPEILAEYNDVLRRPKFGLDPQVLKQWAELLAMRTVNIDSPPKVPDFPRDPKDAPFLAAAMSVRADYLITGDKDLLEAKDIVTTRIVTVVEFAREFQIP
jgi:putative PIN family toxin of toxin-antitoxin system